MARNLRQRAAFFQVGTLFPRGFTCSLYYQMLNTPSGACTVSNLASRYNFTYNWRRVHPMFLLGAVISGFAMSQTGIRQKFLDNIQPTNVRNFWIPHGCVYKKYKYVAFMSKEDAVNFLSIFQPFDLITASLLTVSTVAVITVSSAILRKCTSLFYSYSRMQIIIMMTFYPIKSVLEQGDSTILAAFRKTHSGYFLISTWLFLCYVIGNEYKGVMYSSMTSSPIQPVPESMIDLVMFSDMPYFTTTKHFYQGKPYSTMKDMVLADMIYSGEENFMKKFLLTFRHHLCLLYGRESDIIFNITRKTPVDSEFGPVKITKKFALVSTEEDTDFFLELMKKLTNFYIIPNNKLSPFVSRVPWYGKRNQFLKIFASGLSRLVQSGIYDRWNNHNHKYQSFLKLREVDIKLNITGVPYYGLIVLADSKLVNQKLDGSPVTWNSVDLVFIGCATMIAAAIIFAILEIILGKLWNVEQGTPVEYFFEFTS